MESGGGRGGAEGSTDHLMYVLTLQDIIVYFLAGLASLGVLKWCARTIVQGVAMRKYPRERTCENCGRRVLFHPPMKLPTKTDLYRVAGEASIIANKIEGG